MSAPRSRLHVAMARMRAYDPRPWGVRPVLGPLVGLVVLVVVAGVIALVVHPGSSVAALVTGAALDVGVYLALGLVVRWSGATVARRYGGFGNAFGLRRPVWRDGLWVLAGIGLVAVSRVAISIAAVSLVGVRGVEQAQNVRLEQPGVAELVVFGVVACVLAPVVEETIFRGLLLRTLMRRVGFWAAAVVSSALFGLFHTYEVGTLAGAGVLAAVTASLGLVNCLLVRWTERLTPGIAVHAVFNGLALLVLALRG